MSACGITIRVPDSTPTLYAIVYGTLDGLLALHNGVTGVHIDILVPAKARSVTYF